MDFGHVVLSRSKSSWISKQIAFFTGSYFSHAFVTAPPMCDRLMCLEAVAGGVSAIPFDIAYENCPDESFIEYDVLVSAEIKEKALSVIMNNLEIGYGFLEYPWLIWRWLCKKLGKDIKSHNNWSNDGIICSELVVEYLTECGLGKLFEGFGVAAVTPEDLYQIVLANPQYFKEIKRKDCTV